MLAQKIARGKKAHDLVLKADLFSHMILVAEIRKVFLKDEA